jgi:hypothetical protein
VFNFCKIFYEIDAVFWFRSGNIKLARATVHKESAERISAAGYQNPKSVPAVREKKHIQLDALLSNMSLSFIS